MLVLGLSLILAALLGFAAHRASICTVKAVAEILSRRRARMLLSFLKTLLWVELVTFWVAWFNPEFHPGMRWQLTGLSLVGGVIFGIGAAINQGCSFSTISRLAEGRLRMLATILGLVMGATLYVLLVRSEILWTAGAPQPSEGVPPPFRLPLLVILNAWALYELVRIWRSRSREVPSHRLPLAHVYRLSAAALVLGLSNAVLWNLHGRWSYTTILRSAADASLLDEPAPAALLLWLFLAVIVGALLSAWQRRSFKLEYQLSRAWLPHLLGGTLMGLGAAMTPGGNDVLIFHSIPSLSPHALPAYGAMLLGIAVVLLLVRLVKGTRVRVSCDGDVCREEVIS